MVVAKILVADEDENIRDFLSYYLGKENIFTKFSQTRFEFFSVYESFEPDLLLIDEDIFIEFKSEKNIFSKISAPIVLLVNNNDGKKQAADEYDFITKPFDITETIAKIKAFLGFEKNPDAEYSSNKIVYDNFDMNVEKKTLLLGEKSYELQEGLFNLLNCLASNPNRVFSREQILDEVFAMENAQDSAYIDDCAKELQKMLDGVSEQWCIKSVFGIGYKFELCGLI